MSNPPYDGPYNELDYGNGYILRDHRRNSIITMQRAKEEKMRKEGGAASAILVTWQR